MLKAEEIVTLSGRWELSDTEYTFYQSEQWDFDHFNEPATEKGMPDLGKQIQIAKTMQRSSGWNKFRDPFASYGGRLFIFCDDLLKPSVFTGGGGFDRVETYFIFFHMGGFNPVPPNTSTTRIAFEPFRIFAGAIWAAPLFFFISLRISFNHLQDSSVRLITLPAPPCTFPEGHKKRIRTHERENTYN